MHPEKTDNADGTESRRNNIYSIEGIEAEEKTEERLMRK